MNNKTWLNNFDERQQKEIAFSKEYASSFAHGTDGHNAKMIIAKMAELLDKIAENVFYSEDARDTLLTLEELLKNG